MFLGSILKTHMTNVSTNQEGETLQEEWDRWEGRSHAKLTREGYISLAVMATFLAAVQAQMLSLTFEQEGAGYEVTNAFFIGGLFADMFAAIFSYGSARWFEMLTPEEEDHLHKCRKELEGGHLHLTAGAHTPRDHWVSLSIAMGPYAVVLGLIFFCSGLMVLVWAYKTSVVKIVSTAVFIALVVFIPPFAPFPFRHDRKAVISLLGLKRQSG